MGSFPRRLRPASLPALIVSLAALLLCLPVAAGALRWVVADAVWPWDPAALCAERAGICWPFITEKAGLIFFGTYPHDLLWRPCMASLLLCALAVLTGLWLSGRGTRPGAAGLALLWAAVLAAALVLLGGGVWGMVPVGSLRWNGLPVLLLLSLGSVALAFPLGVLLALAREQDRNRLTAWLAACYIETARGVPMLTVLFTGIFVLPLMLPSGSALPPVAAVLVALILFHAAYFAEDIRGGLRALPRGQAEAAQALGLSRRSRLGEVLLPQAIRRALPSIVNSVIGAYKDTSLVVVVGIHDLTATARMAFSDPAWRAQALEGYFVIGLWFFMSCAFLSMIGRRLQRREAGQ
ncbi:amino acid ABC transporter permease [Mangrovicoccus algicola]|uniref:Amino acid ABC transporter permease n=1 Tax=Mangrovicoccus algicola TaxID=2771008 RepID=A0A8J7CML3_9RHOB|nr:amino acid ABC transporter permease [Mangrovicoccus algicola]MBE3640576.1 amino acid ABC transporter permease [Mangrovicoccus algicola]